MKQIFTGSFTDTERTTVIGENVCEHTFELSVVKYPWGEASNLTRFLVKLFRIESVKRFITIRITSENILNSAVIEHFQKWKSCSLSQSEREELYHIFQVKGRKGKKVVGIGDVKIEIEMETKFERYYLKNGYKTKVKTLLSRNNMKNTEGLVAFYEMLAY